MSFRTNMGREQQGMRRKLINHAKTCQAYKFSPRYPNHSRGELVEMTLFYNNFFKKKKECRIQN